MIDSVIYFSQAALKLKWCHVGQVLNTHNALGEMVERGMGQWLHQTKGGGDLLALQFEGGGEKERDLFLSGG